MKKRLYFMDYLRIAAFALVMIYHMLVQLALDGICPLAVVEPLYTGKNLHMATLGVTLFFMISGFGLMLSSESSFDWKTFYVKRFVRIIIPFYVVYSGVLLCKMIFFQEYVFEGNTPVWRWVFTLTATDEYVKALGMPTFSLGVGEWFLGCLVLIYFIYPLLRECIQRFGWIFFLVATIGFLLLVTYEPFPVQIHMDFFAKAYEFILGMYLAKYREHISITKGILAVLMFLPFVSFQNVIPIPGGMRILIPGVCVFVAVMCMEPMFARLKTCNRVVKLLNDYSYEYYLAHHVIIFKLTRLFALQIKGVVQVLGLFLIEIVVTIVVTIIIKWIVNVIIKLPKYWKLKK